MLSAQNGSVQFGKTNVFSCRKKHFAPFSAATEGKSVSFFGKNVDFRPKQVGEKSQFSLISKAFSGEGEFPFPKTAAFLFCFGQVVLFFFLSALYKSKKCAKVGISENIFLQRCEKY